MSNYPFTNRVNLGNVVFWDPWVGCVKVSEACKYCFFCPKFEALRFKQFNWELAEDLPLGTIISTAFRSDFFIDLADSYRPSVWNIIKEHPNYIFLICTKRVERILECLPADWGAGYDNVVIMVTVENQKRADERLPIFSQIPCKHKWIAAMPLLESINIEQYLTADIEHVEVGGERAPFGKARPLNYDWVVALAQQCNRTNTRMSFMAVGSRFEMNNELFTHCGSACYHSPKADSLELDVVVPLKFNLNNKEFIIK